MYKPTQSLFTTAAFHVGRNALLYRLLVLGFILGASLACNKPGDKIDPALQSPPPSGVGGQWSYGRFSPSSFWGTDGSYSGNANEQAIAFDFAENGTYDMYVMNVATYYSCRTAAYTHFKGKAKFNEDDQSIRLTPTEGSQRGEYGCTPSKNFKRAANAGELEKAHYNLRYTSETDSRGGEVLRIFLSDDDQEGIPLTRASF